MTTAIHHPSSASIDLTLMFGAESYIRHDDAEGDADPWRHDAFRRFVDVVLSGLDVHYPLPDEEDTELRQLGSQLAHAVKFHQIEFTSSPLNPETETQVVGGFSRYLQEAEKRLQLARWLRFQLHPSRVNPTSIRAKREPITQDSYAAWVPHREHLLELAGDFIGLPEHDAIDAGYAVQTVAKSPEEFALLYAFDIYRRGWQYARFAGERGAAYYPHMYRSDCLDQKGNEWKTIQRADNVEFSWSRYFLNLVAHQPHYRNVGRIVDLLNRVREAQREKPFQPWPHLYLEKLARSEELAGEEIDHIVATLHAIHAIAEKAKLPLLKTKPRAPAAVKAVGAGTLQIVKKAIEAIGKNTAAVMTGIDVVTSVIESIPSASVWADQKAAAVLAQVFRGSYNYMGLVPVHVSSFYELFEPTY